MEDALYREIILEHWQHPQNYGVVQSADIDVEATNPLCGDFIRLTIALEKGRVKEVMFMGEGCAISKASASLFTEELKNKSVNEMSEIADSLVLEGLGVSLTPARIKCALLVFQALQKGI
jgi:nitrogen fixation NifU-like protein